MFEGAKHFGFIAIALLAGTLIAMPVTGCWTILPVLVILFYGLVYYNRLEGGSRRENREYWENQNKTRKRS